MEGGARVDVGGSKLEEGTVGGDLEFRGSTREIAGPIYLQRLLKPFRAPLKVELR